MADLVVRRLGTDEEIARVAVRTLARRSVDRVISGMLINMGADFYVDDAEVEAAIAEREQQQAEGYAGH